MNLAFKGKKVCIPAAKLFDEAVMLYRTDKQRYFKIFEKAKNMVETKHNNKDDFMAWVASELPADRYRWVEANILKVEQFAIATKLISCSVFEVSDLTELDKIYRSAERNKFFQIKNRKFIKNINDDFLLYIKFCSKKTETEKPEPLYEDDLRTTTQNTATEEITSDIIGETEYRSYLQNVTKLSDNTCSSYVSAIRNAERYAEGNGYKSCALFGKDKATAVATASELYNDPDFLRYNEQQHRRFTAAINKLLELIGVEIPQKSITLSDIDYDYSNTSYKADSEIITILKQHYEYGFKTDSIRELMRFRQFADTMGIELPEDDNELRNAILASGTIIDGRIYYRNEGMLLELRQIIDDIFSSGVNVIYYESLFENKSEWMEDNIITSSDMLKEYLQMIVPECSFSKKFLMKGNRRSEKDAVTDELKRVWGTKPSVSVDDLHKRLPYIPPENIWRVISASNLFVSTSEGEYLYTDRFVITEDEEKDILSYVEMTCSEKGFASLSDVPINDIEEENYELTQSAIYNAVYKKVLSGKYHINGKILTKEKSELNIITLLDRCIEGKDYCTFDEIADKVIELTGKANRQYAFRALYDDMVRVDKNRFVADHFVNFNVDEIDAVLSRFVIDNFCAIRDITTFALFPFCGQSWNHYVLESFCYRYSKKYSLHVINFNDRNAGIIAEKEYNKTYDEMLAIAVSRSDIELTPDVIGQYLSDTGYTARSKYDRLNEIAQRASELRKGR